MARWIIVGCLFLFLAGCGGQGGDGAGGPAQAGPFTVALATEPDPPKEGLDTNFVVTVQREGAPVTGAQVQVQLTYRGLGGQAGPSAAAQMVAPGRYETGGMVTGMGGKWVAAVSVRHAQGQGQVEIPFAVAK